MLINLEIIKSVEDFPKFYLDKPVHVDTESGGLYVDIRLIQLYQPEYKLDTVYFLDTDLMDLEICKTLIKPLHTTYFNAPYDCGALNMTSAKIDDLQKAVKIAYPEFQSML